MSAEVSQTYRLGPKKEEQTLGSKDTGRGRLMLIKLNNKDCIQELMRRRTRLREAGFQNIYITRDLSPEERKKERELRAELERRGKDTHVIFRGEVVPRKSR